MNGLVRHIARTVGSGVPILILFGLVLWIFDTFLSGVDKLIQEGISFFLRFDLYYPGVGIIAIFALAYLIGLLRKVPWLNKNLTVGRLMSFFSRSLKYSPIVEIEVHPGQYQKGWLKVTREEIVGVSGEMEDFIAFDVYIPTANNPTSGQIWRVNPEHIKFVLEDPGEQLFLYTVSVGRAGTEWKRRWFRAEEFVPPPKTKRK